MATTSNTKSPSEKSTTNYPYIETDKEQGPSLPLTRREIITTQDSNAIKQDGIYVFSEKYKCWHECCAVLRPPNLIITEYEDSSIDVHNKQLLHLQQNWYHGSLSRREAKGILQDFGGGNGSFLVRTSESYNGKFAISFMHESRVKHVVVESKPDSVAHIMYHITPNGPYFDSLYSLIEEARNTAIIQNHAFDLILGSSPPKLDTSWLHQNTRSSSQAHAIMRNEHREGAFLVYKTTSPVVPYALLVQVDGSTQEHLIISTQRPTPAFTLNGVSAPVLYKLIHYFMENPIMGSTMLKYPVADPDSVNSNSALSLKGYNGRGSNELSFKAGSVISNVRQQTKDWSIGSYRGDKNKWFPTNCVRFLTQDELLYIKEVHTDNSDEHSKIVRDVHIIDFSTQSLSISVTVSSNSDLEQLHVKSSDTSIPAPLAHDYLLSAETSDDIRQWYKALQESKLLDNIALNCRKRSQPCSINKERPNECVVS